MGTIASIPGVIIAYYVKWCKDYEIKHTQNLYDKTYRYEFGKNILMNLSPFQNMVQGVPKCGKTCPEQDMGRVLLVSNGFGTTTETFNNTISIQLATAGSRARAGWLPARTKSYRNLPFLPAASWNPGRKTTLWDDQR